VLRKRFGKTVH